MATDNSKANQLKDFDFDNIFDDQQTANTNELGTQVFESFRHAQVSESRNNGILDNDMSLNTHTQQNDNLGSFVQNSANKQDLLQPDASVNMQTQNNLENTKNDIFDEFDLISNNKPKDGDIGTFNIDKNVKQPEIYENQNTDIDLMGMELDEGILNQNIRHLEENLFKKENNDNAVNNPMGLNPAFQSSSDGMINTTSHNHTAQGVVSMKNPDLMDESNNNNQSEISRNFQNKIQDKGFLDFDDLL